MNLVKILAAGNARPAMASNGGGQGSTTSKVTKAAAGYVYRAGTDYRCVECWKFVEPSRRCLSHGVQDVIAAKGYCTYWEQGKPVSAGQPRGSLSKIESGYGELANGTKCRRCINFDGPYCKRVDEKSPGDTPGRIDPDGCCSLQEPRHGRDKSLSAKALATCGGL